MEALRNPRAATITNKRAGMQYANRGVTSVVGAYQGAAGAAFAINHGK